MPFQSLENREDGEEGGDEQEDAVGDEVAQGVVAVDYGWHEEGNLALKTRNMTSGDAWAPKDVASLLSRGDIQNSEFSLRA